MNIIQSTFARFNEQKYKIDLSFKQSIKNLLTKIDTVLVKQDPVAHHRFARYKISSDKVESSKTFLHYP